VEGKTGITIQKGIAKRPGEDRIKKGRIVPRRPQNNEGETLKKGVKI